MSASTETLQQQQVKEPVFVWVKRFDGPPTQQTHQARLLEIRETGYFVRWTVSDREELIPLNSTLKEELPRRRVSATHLESLQEEEVEQVDNLSELTFLALQQGHNRASDTKTDTSSPAFQTPQKKMGNDFSKKRTSASLVNDMNQTSQNKNHHQHKQTKLVKNTATSKQQTTALAPKRVSPDKHSVTTAADIVPLWKIHRIAKAPAVARVADILKPHELEMAADLTANLFLFAFERQSSWHRKNNEANPIWSKSFIFQNYAFANVYRELDRGTTYLRSHVGDLFLKECRKQHQGEKANGSDTTTTTTTTTSHAQSSKASFKKSNSMRRREWIQKILWASYCYRQVNRIEPFEYYGGIPTREEIPNFLEFVSRVRNSSEPDKENHFFNVSTYTATPTFDEYTFHLERSGQANGWLLKSIAGRLAQCYTVSQCWEQLSTRLPGMSSGKYGDEIVWQILCDLLEFKCLPFRVLNTENAMDMCYFSPDCVGKLYCSWIVLMLRRAIGQLKAYETHLLCCVGCCIWFLGTLSRGLKDKELDSFQALQYIKVLVNQQRAIFESLGLEFPAWDGRRLSVVDFVHCLKQFGKYRELQKNLGNEYVSNLICCIVCIQSFLL